MGDRVKLRTGLAAAAAVLLALGASGCLWFVAGAAAGATGVAWVGGKLTKNYDVEYARTRTAASEVAVELGFTVESNVHDETIAKVRARRADGALVRIDVHPSAEKSSRVVVRVGTFGNKEVSMQIMDAIDKKLGK